MSELGERSSRSSPEERDAAPPRARLDAALASRLERLGRPLATWVTALSVAVEGRPGPPLADWGRPATRGGEARRLHATVGGDPPWRLSATVVGTGPEVEALVQQAAVALGSWRESRAAVERSERSLGARTRELDALQALGRVAAEARTVDSLFRSVAGVLQRGDGPDVVLIAHALDGTREVTAFVARPMREADLDALGGRATRTLGWGKAADVRPEIVRSAGYDGARGPRPDLSEEDVVLLPVLRGERPVACLLVLAPGDDEGRLRVLYGAANQLTLHLGRILAVREAEADRFRAIVDSMPQGVVLADRRLRLLQANSSARAMLASEGLETDLPAVLGRTGLAGFAEAALQDPSELAAGEARLDDGRVWSVTASPLKSSREEPEAVVLVLTDVTQARQLQQQLVQSEKMSGLGQLIAGVAHELNNPLASILGYAQLIQATNGDAVLARRLRTLSREAERCRRIVGNLLSFARRREPESRPLALNEVVTSGLSLVGYQLRVHDIRVATELDPGLPPVLGDRHRLEQVVVNLVTNAQQAISSEHRAGRLVVRTRRAAADGAVELEIEDDGPGIPGEIRGKIFDPFFTTKPPGEGTGLGLSLVWGIVRALDGTIEALTPSGGGSLFRLRFPAVARSDEAKPRPSPEPPRGPSRSGRVLVVDDEAPLARLICDALEVDGHVAVSAANGAEAIARIDETEFDLVISDARMPGMDVEALHGRLAEPRPQLARRMLLTTGDTVAGATEAFAARHGLEILAKPFDLDDLRGRVRLRLASTEAGGAG